MHWHYITTIMLLYTGSNAIIKYLIKWKKQFFGGFCLIDVLKKIDFVTSFHKKSIHFTFFNLIYILSFQTLWRLNRESTKATMFSIYITEKNSINKIWLVLRMKTYLSIVMFYDGVYLIKFISKQIK